MDRGGLRAPPPLPALPQISRSAGGRDLPAAAPPPPPAAAASGADAEPASGQRRMRQRWIDGPIPPHLEQLLFKTCVPLMDSYQGNIGFMGALSGRDLRLKITVVSAEAMRRPKQHNEKQGCCSSAQTQHRDELGRVDVVGLVEHLLDEFEPSAPEAWKEVEISEPTILESSPFKLGELLHPAGCIDEPSRKLDLGTSEQVCTVPVREDESDVKRARVSTIMTLAALKEWSDAGRVMPEFDPETEQSSNAAGQEHKRSEDGKRQPDDLTHYDDPLGLFADKLGRALALQRTVDGHQLYPVFHHIHRLGQKSVLESTGSLCPLNHASCEILGVGWSFGQNLTQDGAGNCTETGFYAVCPPKADAMHDYAWSTHVGDCRLPPDDAAALLAKCLTVSYKVVDPVTKQTKKITTVHQGTTTVETVEVGFWGNHYDLTAHNCCHATDHVAKLMLNHDGWSFEDGHGVETRGALDTSVYSLASVGKTIEDGVFNAVSCLTRCGNKLAETTRIMKVYNWLDGMLTRAIVALVGDGKRPLPNPTDPETWPSPDVKNTQLLCWSLVVAPSLIIPVLGLYISHETAREEGVSVALMRTLSVLLSTWGLTAYCATLDPVYTGSDAGNYIVKEGTSALGWWLWLASFGVLYISLSACCLPLFGLCKCSLCDMDIYDEFHGDISQLKMLGPRRAAIEYLKGNQKISMCRGVFMEYANPEVECGICPGRLSMCWFFCNLLTVIITGITTFFFIVMLSIVHGRMHGDCTSDNLMLATEADQWGPELWDEAAWVIWLFWLQPLWVPCTISCGRKVAWRWGGNQLIVKPIAPVASVTNP